MSCTVSSRVASAIIWLSTRWGTPNCCACSGVIFWPSCCVSWRSATFEAAAELGTGDVDAADLGDVVLAVTTEDVGHAPDGEADHQEQHQDLDDPAGSVFAQCLEHFGPQRRPYAARGLFGRG